MAKREVYWTGDLPEKCNLCTDRITAAFVDGGVKGFSTWAIMCPKCHTAHGVGLGIGLGQLFERVVVESGEVVYKKVAG